MTGLTPRLPRRPLNWPDWLLDLHEQLADELTEPLYIVGGAVRDAYLGHPFKDLDLALAGNAVQAARMIANRIQGDIYIMDVERGVARVLLETESERRVIDVARFRGADLSVDLHERDFTLNAIAVDFRTDLTQIIDPLNGEQDLVDRVIRRCSPHALSQDPIRALRAIRQSVELNARIEPATVQDVRAAVPQVMATSAERVRDEFFKILGAARPAAGLRVAEALGLLREIVPEVEPLKGLRQSHPNGLDAWQHTLAVVERLRGLLTVISPTRNDSTAAMFDLGMAAMALDKHRGRLQQHLAQVWPDGRSHEALLCAMALLHDIGKPHTATVADDGRRRFPNHAAVGADAALARLAALRLSNDEKQRAAAVIAAHMRREFWDPVDARDVHRFWRELDTAGVDLCLLVLADYLGANTHRLNQDEWLTLVQRVRHLLDAYFLEYERLVAPPPLVDGTTLITALGLKPGPIIGRLLDYIREEQVVGNVQTQADALEAAQHLLDAEQASGE